MNIAPTNWYPIYLNPTPEEIETLSSTQWDTIRILVIDDSQELCVASGLGNTHQSMIDAVKAHKKMRRISTSDSILYFEKSTAYINDTYTGLGERLPFKKWHRLFSDNHLSILEVLATSRDLLLL